MGQQPRTMRDVLDLIDAVLLRRDEESAKLWNVLTALRGPDSGDEALKLATTCHVRQAAFPRTANRSAWWAAFGPDGRHYTSTYMTPIGTPLTVPADPTVPSGGSCHFSGHVICALKALDLLQEPHVPTA